ncbi:MAG: 50S ribosomal protein L13 [Myxococcota bacterium]|jgi:large subunit ribosomal protein L13|nr:50S ribosomal protein L13 [Myxococcota bacterium]
MRTYVAKPAEAQATRKWFVVDAKDQPLGRLASKIATVLRGKHKPIYQPHVDTGDFVIVVNAAQVKVTGNKANDKMYYRHSGYPGAIRGESFRHLIEKHPDAPLTLAVKGMLPKNVLGRQMLEKLHVYGGSDHPHRAQKPETLAV